MHIKFLGVPDCYRRVPLVATTVTVDKTSDDVLYVTAELQAQEHIGVVVGILFLADSK
jgi:hypothetical protein